MGDRKGNVSREKLGESEEYVVCC